MTIFKVRGCDAWLFRTAFEFEATGGSAPVAAEALQRSPAQPIRPCRVFPPISSAGDEPIATIRCLSLLAAFLLLTGAAELPMHGPLPVVRPESGSSGTKYVVPMQRSREKAGDDAACRAALKAAGADFEEAPAIEDGKACGIGQPVALRELPGGVAVEPAATVRCETALQLARWMEGSVRPAIAVAMPSETITGLSQASAYVCRNRNGAPEGKISEHAFGNAIDIAGFTLKSGKTITIRPADKDATLEGAFQRAITEAACLYFTTVLDPGSDAAHQNHLHLDVKARRGGYRYCW